MSMFRLCAFAMALLAFLLPVYLYGEFIWMAGFWDGFISELQRAEIPLFTAFNWLSLLLSAWFVYLGIIAGRNDIARPLLYSCLLYFAVAIVVGIDQHFRSTLMDDKGS
jgi:hypothetical protein